MEPFRWGIFGTGDISARFASGLKATRDAEVSFIASRSLLKAQRFASGMGIKHAIEGYANAVREGGVDAIYIATPPSEHASHALLCIEAGIPVLVEKPFAAGYSDALKIAEEARSRDVFVMEAMWTRFLPAVRALKSEVSSGTIGDIRLLSGSFCSSQVSSTANNNFSSVLGGGALAHLGAYPLSLGQWLCGATKEVTAIVSVGPSGVEEDVSFSILYENGAIGSFFASLKSWGRNGFQVMGTSGTVAFRGPIVRPHGIRIVSKPPIELLQPTFNVGFRVAQHSITHRTAQLFELSEVFGGRKKSFRYVGNGYNYEADEVRRCVRLGVKESEIMPLAGSISVVETIERIRRLAIRDTRVSEAAL